MKLIKLNKEHYIIVDGFEVKEGDVMYDIDGDIGIAIGKDKSQWEGNMKITHSTQPIDGDEVGACFTKVKQLSLSEVEELFGYSVEKLSEEKCKTNLGYLIDNAKKWFWRKGFKAGFNTHKELVKDKLLSTQLYSNENHLEWIYNRLIEVHGENSNYDYMIKFKEIIQSLQPKTEWEVEFINGKLTLKQ
jgi:hypothetical protein